MPEFGSCGHCNNQWYTACSSGKLRRAVDIPTCPEGAIMAVCEECFKLLHSASIIRIAIRAYKEALQWDEQSERQGVVQVRMSPMEHLLVEASIKAWVPYMKGETTEKPFQQESLSF